MRDDLISRQAAIDVLNNVYCFGVNEYRDEMIYREEALEAINELSITTQPEQKTGRWKTRFDGTWWHYCSECGFALPDSKGEPILVGMDYHRKNEERWTTTCGWCDWLMNYCPNCGAKMVTDNET